MRASQSLSYVIERLPAVPPVLRFLVESAGMSASEAYGTFNMGAGFAFYVAEASVDRAIAVAAQHGNELLRAGYVEAGPKRVVVKPLGLTYDGESLGIRG
jgi:phosphoribosylformylglycinamidine cyclo-ligase